MRTATFLFFALTTYLLRSIAGPLAPRDPEIVQIAGAGIAIFLILGVADLLLQVASAVTRQAAE